MSYVTGLRCLHCDARLPEEPIFDGCPECRTNEFTSNVVPTYDYDGLGGILSRDVLEERGGGVWANPELLPVDERHSISIGEGDTPLIDISDLGSQWGLSRLHVKDESQNPTWSYKDRLCAVAVAKARELDAEIVTIASTGNHGASTAAYAARAGLDCVVFTIPEVPETMKTLMQVYGANVIATPTHEDRWTIMNECIDEYGWYPTGNHVYPPVGSNFYGIEGYKSIAYEICMQLEWEVPDWVIQPTAYADGLSGIWRGFEDLYQLGLIDELPRMVAVEPHGPLRHALEAGLDRVEPVEAGETVAFSIGATTSTQQGLRTLRTSDGLAVLTNDTELRELQLELGERTGLYAEASAVAAVAGARSLATDGVIDPDDLVVALDTSTGLKDTSMTAESMPDVPTIEPTLGALRSALAEHYGVEM